jgi:3-oxoacyl-[acyl-carrier-protein] synthase III
LNKALGEFRLSVHAWSDAAYGRTRTAVVPNPRRVWWLAAGWALGCVLVAGGASAGVWEHHQHQQEMRIAAAHAVGQQRQATQVREQQVREEKADLLTREDLLAKVDKDVSREVPAAMEPLGQLMAEDETQ